MVLMNNIDRVIRDMPKTELHIHLEGAIPLETLFTLIQKRGGDPSVSTLEDLQRKLTYTDFEHFISTWTWKNKFIREERDFEEITYQALRTLSQQNVKYVEAFYSPGDFWRHGLSVAAITEYTIKGKEKARRDFGIRSELIIDLVRDHGPNVGMQRLEDVEPYLGKGVIGVGLGGSEQAFPADHYETVYREAKHRGFRLTAHAGEAGGPESIWAAVKKLGCERIGHGVRAAEDPTLVALLRKERIPLEVCMISNVKTGVFESLEAHPIRRYFKDGLMVTVNSDDPTMFNTSITQEYSLLVRKLGFTLEDVKQLTLNGVEASFLPDVDKGSLKSQFENEWQRLFDKHC